MNNSRVPRRKPSWVGEESPRWQHIRNLTIWITVVVLIPGVLWSNFSPDCIARPDDEVIEGSLKNIDLSYQGPAVAWGTTSDNQGNIYVTGDCSREIHSASDDSVPRAFKEYRADAFVSKMDPCGNRLWDYSLEGEGYQGGRAVTVDSAGAVYVAGFFEGSITAGIGHGPHSRSSQAPHDDCFLVKMTQDGHLEQLVTWGSGAGDEALSVRADDRGAVYVAGMMGGSLEGSGDPGSNGEPARLGFLSKFNSELTIEWTDYCASYAKELAISEDCGIFVVGSLDSNDGGSADLGTAAGGSTDWRRASRAVLTRCDPEGRTAWSLVLADGGGSGGTGVAVARDGSVYVTGWFIGTADFHSVSGREILESNGTEEDAFLACYAPSGDCRWVRSWETEWGAAFGPSIAVDPEGSVYVAGGYKGLTDLDPGDRIDQHISMVGDLYSGHDANYWLVQGCFPWLEDVFVSKFDTAGDFIWGRTFGGAEVDFATDLGVSADGSLNVVGESASQAFLIVLLPDGSIVTDE